MKRKTIVKKGALVLASLIMLAALGYVFCTTDGALRFALVRQGYPRTALSVSYYIPESPVSENGETIYTFKNPPDSEGNMINWRVKKVWIFKWGSYYGY